MEQQLMMLAAQQGIRLLCGEPLSRHTTFQIGGPARWLALPETEMQLCALLELAAEQGLRFAVIGRGSDLLAPDEGFDGLVIRTPEGAPVWLDETTVQVPAGYSLSRLSALAAERGLAGLTFAQGIPGTVGGGILMNAGAYGGQIADTLLSSVCHTPEGLRELSAAEHDFAYRSSIYSSHPDWVILHGVFRLQPGARAQLLAEMADYAVRRREKQPLEYPSAGSAFKRPEGQFAGRLIEESGLKGCSVGGAQISEKHAGFIINRGGATCADVLTLIRLVQERVQERTGILLEPEIRVLK